MTHLRKKLNVLLVVKHFSLHKRNKASNYFSISLQVHLPPSQATVRKDTIVDLVHSLPRQLMDSLEKSALKVTIVSGVLLHQKVVLLEHFPTH